MSLDSTLTRSALEAAAEFAARFAGDPPPPPLRDMAREMGIRHIELKARLPAAGLLLRRGPDLVVVIRAEDPPVRQRFSLAHEIAHALLEREGVVSDLGCHDPTVERLCDQIAGELLLPRNLFRSPNGHTPLELAVDVAQRCRASVSAAALRLVELGRVEAVVAWATYPRPGGDAKLRVLWSQSRPGIYVPRHATPAAELELTSLEQGEPDLRQVRLQLGSLYGNYAVESVRLRYSNASGGQMPELISAVSSGGG